MKLYRCSYLISLIIILAVYPGAASSDTATREKRFPMTVGETTEVIEDWFRHKGYQVRQDQHKVGHRTLHATGHQEDWQIQLSPHSPLATRVTVTGPGLDPEIEQQLWDHISRHLGVTVPPPEASSPSDTIPASVLLKIESVVCISARSDTNEAQFSGFIVDTDGLILCTAHGLQNLSELTITLYDGRETTGRILHRDPRQDLVLIQMPLTSETAISLFEGRNLLGLGERVFTVGCPVNLRGTIYAGSINGPPRRVDELPLWQVQMEVHPGSSGSPVFDYQGNLVGMVKGRYRGTTTMGFVIPLETIINVLKENRPR